jgi:hypothetical protein
MLLLCLVFTINANAQDKTVDSVYMLSGDIKEGKVTAVNNNTIKFVYKGETLEYELKKQEIAKIVFASGRTEVYNSFQDIPPVKAVSPTERKGKLAVLPFGFVTNDTAIPSDGMSHTLQQSCVDALKHDNARIAVQDPMQTNALLAKNNIDAKNAVLLDPKDLAGMLGVEFVVYGTTNIVNKGSSTYGSGSSTYSDKKDKGKSSGTEYSSNNSTTIINYETTVDIKIYNDQGNNTFNNSRQAFGTQIDSYVETIKYIMKRTPFGSKSK